MTGMTTNVPANVRSKLDVVQINCHAYVPGTTGTNSPAVHVTVTFGVPVGSTPAPAAPAIPVLFDNKAVSPTLPTFRTKV